MANQAIDRLHKALAGQGCLRGHEPEQRDNPHWHVAVHHAAVNAADVAELAELVIGATQATVDAVAAKLKTGATADAGEKKTAAANKLAKHYQRAVAPALQHDPPRTVHLKADDLFELLDQVQAPAPA